ncbi:bacteriophage abortive infection AbiH family protein [Pseudaquidulcibacter saccharophilus]|uniref:bacteriophage abortive infection AbiH family protein n=1 Tax=Pseudaquidulcibacter saccharophilus TaxID=2831900 RepID=UPI001EFF5BB5|nr:bacteriophage abortive infection AbiH family protein [Pseudaquidulcibacter saccharophilus]
MSQTKKMTTNIKPKRRLFIIGNGFDLYHLNGSKPDTSYNSFAAHIKANKKELFELICQSFPLSCDTTDRIWGEFESALANFDHEYVFEECNGYLDDSDPHRMGEASWEAQRHIEKISKGLAEALNEFIKDEVKFPILKDNIKLPLPQNEDDLYLSFNYTNTLERYYQILASQICYIHGKAGENSALQIGHSVKPHSATSARPILETAPENLTDGKRELWDEYMNDKFSQSTEWVYDEIDMYWALSFKNAKTNIKNNINFFDKAREIANVSILGHSLSGVDLPYLEEIRKRASKDAIWRVSYFSENDREKHRLTLNELGVHEEFIVQAPLGAILTST